MPVSHVALMRGINVGGKNLIAMPLLAKLFVQAGCTDVRTYIQSGNVLFQASAAVAKRVPATVNALIARQHQLRVPIVLRTRAELARAIAQNPFPEAVKDPRAVHVFFLDQRPSAAAVSRLDPHRSPPDEFRVVGKELYLHAPGGVARTRFTSPYLDATLETVSTARNWRTVTTLHGMAAGESGEA